VFGTRPEAIKMAPLVRECGARPAMESVVCLTGQHREMLDQVNQFFGIRGDYDLDVMRPNQGLAEVTASILQGVDRVIEDCRPDVVMVQGDTSTAFAGALAAYYRKVPVAHLEAGLRSGDRYSPFPEETNRTLVGHMAELHFAPTGRAAENLRREGVTDGIHVVGNTVIDALYLGLQIIRERGEEYWESQFPSLDLTRRLILVTGHRRESFGEPFERICAALGQIARAHPDCLLVYPVHLNPKVREPVHRLLGGVPNVVLMEPLDYPRLIWLMNHAEVVLTDSGGIQEEAPSLGKPVLVMRDVTERVEGIQAGTAKLVGTDTARIVEETTRLLSDRTAYDAMARAVNPYGDGTTSLRVADILRDVLSRKVGHQR
jgi:UDP-N-acetylglucosamine 2-epimerase (non-hydrolysing)